MHVEQAVGHASAIADGLDKRRVQFGNIHDPTMVMSVCFRNRRQQAILSLSLEPTRTGFRLWQ